LSLNSDSPKRKEEEKKTVNLATVGDRVLLTKFQTFHQPKHKIPPALEGELYEMLQDC